MASGELTEKQEAFARAYFETGNAAEAYRRSYNVSELTRDSWIYVEACQLLDNPKISQRVKSLRAQAERLSIFTRQKALEELEEARLAAHQLGQASAAVSAITQKAKLCGFDRSVVELTGKDGGPLESSVTHNGEIAISGTAAFIAEALGGGAGSASEESGEG